MVTSPSKTPSSRSFSWLVRNFNCRFRDILELPTPTRKNAWILDLRDKLLLFTKENTNECYDNINVNSEMSCLGQTISSKLVVTLEHLFNSLLTDKIHKFVLCLEPEMLHLRCCKFTNMLEMLFRNIYANHSIQNKSATKVKTVKHVKQNSILKILALKQFWSAILDQKKIATLTNF